MTVAYNQVTDHELNAIKGPWGTQAVLDKTLKFRDYNDGIRFYFKGRCVSIHPTDLIWELGCPKDSAVHRIPWFVWDGNEVGQFDVNSVPGGMGGGRFPALCANGPYELFTTEITPSVSYPANKGLIAVNTADATQGTIGPWNGSDAGSLVGFVTPDEFPSNPDTPTNPGTTQQNKQYVCFISAFHRV